MRRSPPIVLCYHAISASWPTSLAVSLERFATQLERFVDRGYVGLTFGEAERLRQSNALPPRTLVVTFDDAYASTAAARPVLRRLGLPATVFVVGDFLASGNLLTWPGIEQWSTTPHRDELRPLGIEELRQLQQDGWEIGSHTMRHPSLPDLDDDDCRDELSRSRSTVAELFGSCTSIAYPYGRTDARVAALAARAGYEGGCYLAYSHIVDEPLRRPRVAVSGTDMPVREWAKMAPLPMRLRRSPLASLLGRL
jgi:peptidoglycan/xylan/chitin deacetylase (PgdA/CDA1 family)